MDDRLMTVTNEALQTQITGLDRKVDERHENNQKLLGDLAAKMDTLIELNLGQKLQAQLIGQISEKLKDHDALFSDLSKRLVSAEASIKVHAWTWKIVGAVLLVSIGGIGWMLDQMKDFYQEFGHVQDKVSTLEFLVQGRTTTVLPPAQTSSGSK